MTKGNGKMSDAVITLKNIKKSYGKTEVLRDVDLEVNRGDIYGLIGRNGSGKSTMFKIILGLTEFTSGEVHIGDAGDTPEEGRAKTGFFIGQNFFSYLSARQNLEYYRRLKKIRDRHEVDRVLKLVELDNTGRKKVRGFSMGMRQRLGIANALLGNPEIIILDEPTNGLDPQGIADIRNLVKKINAEYGTTVIISSHILSELQNTANRFGILNEGVIAKVLTDEDLKVANNYVRISVDDAPRARQVLEENGIRIFNESSDTMSLEDYYFNLVGGPKQ